MRLPPALAAAATPRILELLGPPPGRVLELGFAGIHAVPLRLAGFDVVVVERDSRYIRAARGRAGDALAEPPAERFDVAIAQEDADLRGIAAGRVIFVRQDGTTWSSASS